MNKWNVESEDTYSAFFGYFHLPYATLSIAFFFPEEPQSNNLAAGTLSRGGIWQLWTTIFYKCQTVPFILLWKHYYTTMEPLQFHQYFVMSGDKRAFCAPEDLKIYTAVEEHRHRLYCQDTGRGWLRSQRHQVYDFHIKHINIHLITLHTLHCVHILFW